MYMHVCVCVYVYVYVLFVFVCLYERYLLLSMCVYIYVYTHISSCRGPHKASPLNARMVAAYGLTFLPPGGRGLWFEASTLPNDKALGITSS